jgi:hypothetical protein
MVCIRQLFGCHHETLQLEMQELQDETILEEGRIRQPEGGRKPVFETITARKSHT